MRPQRALIGVYTCSLIQWCTCTHGPGQELSGLHSWALPASRCPAQRITSSEHDAVLQQPLQHGPTPSSSPQRCCQHVEGRPAQEGRTAVACCAQSSSPACSTRPSNHLQSGTGVGAVSNAWKPACPGAAQHWECRKRQESWESDHAAVPTYGLCVPPGLQQGGEGHETLGKHGSG